MSDDAQGIDFSDRIFDDGMTQSGTLIPVDRTETVELVLPLCSLKFSLVSRFLSLEVCDFLLD